MRIDRGFSLIEALVVIAITAILALVAIPTLGAAYANYRLGNATTTIGQAIARARFQATSQNAFWVVEQTADQVSIWREQNMDLICSTPAELGSRLVHPLPEGVVAESIDFGLYPSGGGSIGARLVFEPDGSIMRFATEPPLDNSVNPAVRRPRLVLRVSTLLSESTRELRVDRFGGLVAVD